MATLKIVSQEGLKKYSALLKTYLDGKFESAASNVEELEKVVESLSASVGVTPSNNGDSTYTAPSGATKSATSLAAAIVNLNEEIGVKKAEGTAATGIYSYIDTAISTLEAGDIKTIKDAIGESYFTDGSSPDPVDERLDALEKDVDKLNDEIGVLNNLTTTEKTTVVGAINELDGEIGTWKDKEGKTRTDTVKAAIEAIESELGGATGANIDKLATALSMGAKDEDGVYTAPSYTVQGAVKENVGDAISSIGTEISTVKTNIGTVSGLTANIPGTGENTTPTKASNLVEAINANTAAIAAHNEAVNTLIGDLDDLTTKDKKTVVAAINEVKGEVDVLNGGENDEGSVAKQIKDAIASVVTDMNFMGGVADVPTTGSGANGALENGDTFVVTTAFDLTTGEHLQVGDVIIYSKKDNEEGKWVAVQSNVDIDVSKAVSTSEDDASCTEIAVFDSSNKVVKGSGFKATGSLTTNEQSDLVAAINELDAELGTITATEMGTAASTVSGAIKELKTALGATVATADGKSLSEQMGYASDDDKAPKTVVEAINNINGTVAVNNVAADAGTNSGIKVEKDKSTTLTNMGVATVVENNTPEVKTGDAVTTAGKIQIKTTGFTGGQATVEEITLAETLTDSDVKELFDEVFTDEEKGKN